MKIFDSREEYETAALLPDGSTGFEDGTTIYAAAINLPLAVAERCRQLERIRRDASSLDELNSIFVFKRLRKLRAELEALEDTARDELDSCLKKLAEPVSGGTLMENAWIQGATVAAGSAAVSRLNFALAAAGEVLDRKAAYAVACFSLYISIFSLIVAFLSWK